MTELLSNHLGSQWIAGRGAGGVLTDPVRGGDLDRVDATGPDLGSGFTFAGREGGAALRARSYAQPSELLTAVARVLQGHRLNFYPRLAAVQASAAVVAKLGT